LDFKLFNTYESDLKHLSTMLFKYMVVGFNKIKKDKLNTLL